MGDDYSWVNLGDCGSESVVRGKRCTPQRRLSGLSVKRRFTIFRCLSRLVASRSWVSIISRFSQHSFNLSLFNLADNLRRFTLLNLVSDDVLISIRLILQHSDYLWNKLQNKLGSRPCL